MVQVIFCATFQRNIIQFSPPVTLGVVREGPDRRQHLAMIAPPDAPGSNIQLHAPWMPPPRLPKVSGQLGDGPVEDFIAEAERIIAAYDLEGQLVVELLLKHLDGQARREVLAQAPAARVIAGVVLGLLREAFGDHRPLTQLVTAFHCRQQWPVETVLEFSHSLQVLAARITGRDPDALSDRSLRDRFCEVLGETALKRELRGVARELPDVTLAVLRREESCPATASDAGSSTWCC